MSRYPKMLAAAERLDEDEWAFCDAVLWECGRAGTAGVYDRISEAHAELIARGYHYERKFLQECRDVAHRFPPETRVSSIGIKVHRAAGDPAVLNVLTAYAKDTGEKLTVKWVKKFIKELHRDDSNPLPRTPPNPTTVSMLVLISDIITKGDQAHQFAVQALRAIEPRRAEASSASASAVVEVALKAHEAWLAVANALRNAGHERGHISVVGKNP
jgi:hypothetical protein